MIHAYASIYPILLHLLINDRFTNFSQILNETTFTRGTCPYLSNLALSVDGKEVTRIQADGKLDIYINCVITRHNSRVICLA